MAAWVVALAAGALGCGGGGGGGGGKRAALDPTQQPQALAGPHISVRGGDGGEGEDGGPGGTIMLMGATVALVPAGAGPIAGEYDGVTDTPDDPDRLFVPAGQVVQMDRDALDAQTWSSVAILGELVIDFSTTTDPLTITTSGDARIAGLVRSVPANVAPNVSLLASMPNTACSIPGVVDFAQVIATGTPRFAVSDFASVRVDGTVDVSGLSGETASKGGTIEVLDAVSVVLAGTLRADGGSGGFNPPGGGGQSGGVVTVGAPSIIVRGSGIQAFGGQGGVFDPNGAIVGPGSGGDGGALTIIASDEVEVRSGVTLRLSGGRANGSAADNRNGGDAGSVAIAVKTGGARVAYGGRTELVGGFAPFDLGGDGGALAIQAGDVIGPASEVELSAEVLALGGATGDGGDGGRGGLFDVLVAGAQSTVSVSGVVRLNGGPAIIAAAPGTGGLAYLGVGPIPLPTSTYPATASTTLALLGRIEALGGSGGPSGQTGAGGVIDLNVGEIAFGGGTLAAVGGDPPASGMVVTRPQTTVLGDAAAATTDDDGDQDGTGGDLDRVDTRP